MAIVNGILNEFLFTKTDEEDIGNIWFQQDGATSDVLRPVFEDRIISRRADVIWTIICGMPSKIAITPTSHRQLMLYRTIFVKPLVKYSCTQSMCLKIGPVV